MKAIQVGSQFIGQQHAPAIVAELSGNHNQSLERALHIVDAMAEAGIKFLKLQTYTPDTMTLDLHEKEFFIHHAQSLWKGESLYQLYKKAHTPWEWHLPIFERCKKWGMIYFSTPFDISAVDFLETLNVPLYKIASFENVDLPLIRSVAKTGKPIVISTGMANIAEIHEAVEAARSQGCKEIILLKCASIYPADPESANLLTMPHMQELFQCQVGYSDHTEGMGAAIGAVALGAVMIEKHCTLKRSEGGVDAAFSLEPSEMRQLVVEAERAWKAKGVVHYGVQEKEIPSLQYRRSLYIVSDLKVGDVLTRENLRPIRPGLGLHPKYYDLLLGRIVKKEVKRGTPMHWDLV